MLSQSAGGDDGGNRFPSGPCLNFMDPITDPRRLSCCAAAATNCGKQHESPR